jgi:hypothetical protein
MRTRSTTAERGVAGGVDEVGVGPVGKSGNNGLGVRVIQQRLGSGLGEAGKLRVDRLLEAFRVGFESEGAGEQIGVLLQICGVRGRDATYGSEILFDAGLLEAGFDEVLLGADENAGMAFYGGAEGGKVAAGFGSHENDDLLGLGGDSDERALLPDMLVGGVDAGEPVVGRRVGGAAQEADDHEVFDRLGGGQVGMDPEPVTGLQVGDLGDVERFAGAGDADVDPGAGEIEARIGERCPMEGEKDNGRKQPASEVHQTASVHHTASLDAR